MNDKKQIYYKYFNEHILPVVVEYEQVRRKTLRKVIISSSLFFIAGVMFAVLFIYNALYGIFSNFLLPVLLFFMYAFILKGIINIIIECRNYQKSLIDNVLVLFFKPVANFKMWPKNHDITSILDSCLFSNIDTREDNLSFFGLYNNSNILVADTRLTYSGALNQNLFKGTLIQLELPFSINNHLIMLSKNEKVCNKFSQINPHIEDFNKYLYMFAKNQKNLEFVDDRFWQIIKRFGNTYTAKGFLLSFKDNVLLIALRQKNPMKFGFLFSSLLKPQNYDDLIEKFILIFDLLDALND